MPRGHEERHITPAVLIEPPHDGTKQFDTSSQTYHQPHLATLAPW